MQKNFLKKYEPKLRRRELSNSNVWYWNDIQKPTLIYTSDPCGAEKSIYDPIL